MTTYYEAVRPSPAHRYFRPRGWSRLRLFPWHRWPGSHVPYDSLALASLDLACRDHSPDVSPTLTTTVFDRSSSRWLGISDLIAEPEGPAFISRTVAHRRVDRRCS